MRAAYESAGLDDRDARLVRLRQNALFQTTTIPVIVRAA
jgi:hypothetical protein